MHEVVEGGPADAERLGGFLGPVEQLVHRGVSLGQIG